jgi:hypothetical protein
MELIKDLSLLEQGDEIVIATSSSLKRIKLLQKPELSKVKSWNGSSRYKAVKASVKRVSEDKISGNYKYTVVSDVFAPAEEHNFIKRFNLNFKDVLLIKREI